MRAEAVDRAVIAGWSEGGTLAAFFAATYPERTEGLILSGAFASLVRRDDHPVGADPARSAVAAVQAESVGLGHRRTRGEAVRAVDGGAAGIPALGGPLRTRLDISPELRPVQHAHCRRSTSATCCPSIYAPTLVMHARGDRVIPFQSGRYLADHVVGRALRGASDGRPRGLVRRRGTSTPDAIEEFLTGTRQNDDHSRRLATVLFTDIVDSTVNAERAGRRGVARRVGPPRRLVPHRDRHMRRPLDQEHGRRPAGDLRQPEPRRPMRVDADATASGRNSGSRYAPGFTPARSRRAATTWPG